MEDQCRHEPHEQAVESEHGDGPAERAENERTAAKQAAVVEAQGDPGRGGQLAAGVGVAQGEWLWMLHADNADVASALQFLLLDRSPCWGRFDVRLTTDNGGSRSALQLVAAMMNWRSRVTSICTGDQAIFVHRSLLEQIGGIPEQPLMEDVELSRRLKRLKPATCPEVRISASGRRWLNNGVVSTILSMWLFRLRYFFGSAPEALARRYYRG